MTLKIAVLYERDLGRMNMPETIPIQTWLHDERETGSSVFTRLGSFISRHVLMTIMDRDPGSQKFAALAE